MAADTDGVLLTDGRSSVLLHPPKQFPGEGFEQQIDLVGGPFRGSIKASSYEGPRTLRAFHTQLVALYQSLKGEAKLGYTYDNLNLTLSGNGMGHIQVQVDAIEGELRSSRLSFSFYIDQTLLPDIIAAVERDLLG